jgi:hypothetical protein
MADGYCMLSNNYPNNDTNWVERREKRQKCVHNAKLREGGARRQRAVVGTRCAHTLSPVTPNQFKFLGVTGRRVVNTLCIF